MAEPSAFISDLLTLLTPLGDVTSKRMFGGYGLFYEGAMFALVSRSEALFLKADEVNKGAFIEIGAKTHGKMPYYAAPAETLESWAAMERWAKGSVEAALRAKKK